MAREKRNLKSQTFKIDAGVVDKLDEFSDATRIPKSRIVEDGVMMFMKDYMTGGDRLKVVEKVDIGE